MNLNQIINMALRMIMRRGINFGINKGVDMMARRGKKPAEMTREDHMQAQNSKKLAQRVRQASNITRRLFR